MNLPYLNTTQIPNVIFDHWMARLTLGQFKVLLAICRKTYGWHKARDSISLSQLCKTTGMSRQGVINALNILINLHLVKKDLSKSQAGDNATNSYEINLASPPPLDEQIPTGPHSLPPSQMSRPRVVNSVDHGVVNSVDTQKKYYTKERLTKEEAPPDGDFIPPPLLSDVRKRTMTSSKKKPSFRKEPLIERASHLPEQAKFTEHFKLPLVGISEEHHQKLIKAHGATIVAQGYEYLAQWKLSKAECDSKALKQHTDYHRLCQWVFTALSQKSSKTVSPSSGLANRKLAERVWEKVKNTRTDIHLCSKYIEFEVSPHSPSVVIKFEDKDFKTRLFEQLKKRNITLD